MRSRTQEELPGSLVQAAQSPFPSRLPSALSHRDLGLRAGAPPMGRHSRQGRPYTFGGTFGISTKALGEPVFDSLLERDFQTVLCADPRITSYAVQSCQLIYWTTESNGSQTERTYTPDVCALLATGQVAVIEVKHSSLRRRESWKSREPYIRTAFREDHDVNFIVVTEHEVRIEPRLTNYQQMLRFAHPYDDIEAELAVTDALANFPRLSHVGEVCDASVLKRNTLNRSFSAIMRLALRGQVSLDMAVPLSLATRLNRTSL